MSYTPRYTISNQTLSLVAEISEMIGKHQLRMEDPTPVLRRKNRIRTIQGSLAIEQNTLTLEQVTAVLNGKHVLAPTKDILEVRNAFAAYDELENYDPYSPKDLLKAHGIMMKHLMDFPGCFRETQVGVADEKGQIIHYGTLPRYVPQVIGDLLNWVKQTDLHPLVRSCVFHFEFENIHPFADGNGRIGRLWHTLLLSRWNGMFRYLPVESLVREHQNEYYRAINRSDIANDSCAFIEFMLEVILETLQKAAEEREDAGKNETSFETSLKQVLQPREWEKLYPIVRYVSEHGEITPQTAAQILGRSRTTAFRYLKVLVEKKIFERRGNTNQAAYYLCSEWAQPATESTPDLL